MTEQQQDDSPGALFLRSAVARFQSQKELGERALSQIPDEDLTWSPDADSNSIAILMRHMAGNMLSRWTNFLTTDGEKPTRGRDAEFEVADDTRARLMARWDEGWRCLFAALEELSEEDLTRTVAIRGEAHTVVDAILRQLSHYGQHVGQIVYIAKMRKSSSWKTLSIPRKRPAKPVGD